MKEFRKTETYRGLLDKVLIWSYRRKLKSGDEKIIINLPSHTIEENRRKWNNYDWSKMGNTDPMNTFILTIRDGHFEFCSDEWT